MSAAALAMFSRRSRIPLHDSQSLRSALKLRYQVYCEDCRFLSPTDYPEKMESDEHDHKAAHFYEFDAQGHLAGYVRLVRPDAEQRFPFQAHCLPPFPGIHLPPAGHSAEISRLIIRDDFRRRRSTDQRCGESALSGPAQREPGARAHGERRYAAPLILLNLYRQMYVYSCENAIRYWYAAMERPLARSIMRMNVNFMRIGPESDYYGPVAPYVTDLRELEAATVQDWLLRRKGVSEAVAVVKNNHSAVEVDFSPHRDLLERTLAQACAA